MEIGGEKSFRSCLEEAVLAWNEENTVVGNETYAHHQDTTKTLVVVDYATFKRQLRTYSQRRTRLRRLVDNNRESTTKSVNADEVKAILENPENNQQHQQQAKPLRKRNLSHLSLPSAAGDCYLSMTTDNEGGCHNLSGIFSKRRKKKRMTQREILRAVSSLEREGVEDFLSEQALKISSTYRSRAQHLGKQLAEWRTKLWHQRGQSRASSMTRLPVVAPDPSSHDNQHNTIVNTSEDDLSEITRDMAQQTLAIAKDDNISKITRDMAQQTLAIAKALLDLEAFCVLNILVLRQTLIRYDAFARFFGGTPLMEFYLKTVMHSKNPSNTTSFVASTTQRTSDPYYYELRQILVHTEILDLCEDFICHLELLSREHEASDRGDQGTSDVVTAWSGMGALLRRVVERFRSDRLELHVLLETSAVDKADLVVAATKSPSQQWSATKKKPTIAQKMLDTIGKYFLTNLEDQFGWYIDGPMHRGKNLSEEMSVLVIWRRTSWRRWCLSPEERLEEWGVSNPLGDGDALVSTCDLGHSFLEDFECDTLVLCGDGILDKIGVQEDAESNVHNGSNDNEITTQQKFNLFMALVGGFLYCMNYYIVEPSSTMYVNALGAQDAAGATLIAMMPIAAFLAAIVYSIWTNRVFRQPFLVSCSLMVTGNVMYSLAFNYKSLSMALLGRFLTGLGGPKMIVRRYMADTTSVNIRTSVNALFGMVIAAGSALGPGCAIVLSNFEFTISFPGGSEIWFNSMTGPGWFMAILWGFFSVALFVGFREQDRIGLAEKLEQDRMEQLHETLLKDHGDGARRNSIIDDVLEDSSDNSNEIEDGLRRALPASREGSISAISSTNVKSSMSVMSGSITSECYYEKSTLHNSSSEFFIKKQSHAQQRHQSLWKEFRNVSKHLLFPVRICMGLLFAKVFVIETVVSCTSVLSKNRYDWTIRQVGMLGCANGFFVIPVSIVVGKLSLQYQDRCLMVWLLSVGIAGLCLLVDATDLADTSDEPHTFNKNLFWSVGPIRYVMGYFITYLSIQSFEGIIGSALSKLIPTALAQGTFNSGLLATLVDTFGRSCGDLFISLMGYLNIRQLMNLLFIPGVMILVACLFVVRKYYDVLAV